MSQGDETVGQTAHAIWDRLTSEHEALGSFEFLVIYFVRAEPDELHVKPSGKVLISWTEISRCPLVAFENGLFSLLEYDADGEIQRIVQTESVAAIERRLSGLVSQFARNSFSSALRYKDEHYAP